MLDINHIAASSNKGTIVGLPHDRSSVSVYLNVWTSAVFVNVGDFTEAEQNYTLNNFHARTGIS